MAFKMNRDGFTFYTKPTSPNTDKHSHAKMVDKGYPKYDHDKGPTKYDDTHMTRYKSHATLQGDLDKDGELNDYEKNRQNKIDEAMNKSKDGPPKNKHSHNTMRTPYEKNKYSSNMTKHNKGHKEELTPQTVNPDPKRKQSIINKLKGLKDPVDSEEGKRLTNILMNEYNMSADGVESAVGFR